ncbi:MAG: SRPBCC domain-containing protein, partial [Chloroflexaceae bacterium]|nr:SRPBCC domain-containing protein [Chloroflexaceae bacterium]
PPQPQYHHIPIYTTFRLTEENGGTRVTVTETGFEALPDEIRQQRFDSTAQGYATVLAELKVYGERTNR